MELIKQGVKSTQKHLCEMIASPRALSMCSHLDPVGVILHSQLRGVKVGWQREHFGRNFISTPRHTRSFSPQTQTHTHTHAHGKDGVYERQQPAVLISLSTYSFSWNFGSSGSFMVLCFSSLVETDNIHTGGCADSAGYEWRWSNIQ